MPSQYKAARQRRRPGKRIRHGGSGAALDSPLAAMAETLGNRELEERLQRATDQRDALLRYIVERLGNIRQVQLKEFAAVNRRSRPGPGGGWFRGMAMHWPGFSLPDTGRWHKPAREYRDAARAIASGNLSRGAKLLQRAMDSERAAIDSAPGMLSLPIQEGGQEGDVSYGPEALEEIGEGEGCPAGALPEGLKLADDILRLDSAADQVKQVRPKSLHRWWWDEEEEEEEEDEAAEQEGA